MEDKSQEELHLDNVINIKLKSMLRKQKVKNNLKSFQLFFRHIMEKEKCFINNSYI